MFSHDALKMSNSENKLDWENGWVDSLVMRRF